MSDLDRRICTEADARAVLAALGIEYEALTKGRRDGELVILSECHRCGGQGHLGRGFGPWAWQTCFRCRGVKGEWRPLKKYARLARARYRRAKKREETQEEREAERARKAADREAKKLEGQRRWNERHGYGRVTFAERDAAREAERAAEREARTWVGEVGERREFELTVRWQTGWETPYGWQSLYKFSDDTGNTLVWKTSAGLWVTPADGCGDRPGDEGDAVRVKATVKAHDTFRGERQTVLTRVKVLSLVAEASDEAA